MEPQDLDTIAALHHDDIVFENHTVGERAEGAAAVREHIAQIFRNNPTMRFQTRALRAGEDFAVCEWTLTLERGGDTTRVGRGRRLPDRGRPDRAQGRLLGLGLAATRLLFER